jgi:hypothetical protein
MKYKKILVKALQSIVIIASLVMVSSCEDFLDLKPISSSSADGFYQTQDDFEQAVNGAYATLREVYSSGYYMLFADLRADNTTMLGIGGGTEERKIVIDNFNLDPTNEHMLTMWRTSYTAIQRANGVLSNISSVDFDQIKKDQYTGESKAVRALTYFNLVRIFGGVPLITTGDVDISASYDTPRASADDIYSLIVDDLTDAIEMLPPTYPASEAGRVSKGAAQTLLGQVYLTQHKYADAVTQFNAVITSGNYDLLDNYGDNFTGIAHDNLEIVWQIVYKGGTPSLGSSFPNWCAPVGSERVLVELGGAYGFNQPTLDVFNAYTADDLRRDVSIGVGFTNTSGNYIDARYIKLYVDGGVGDGSNDSDVDWNVFRYSHVLLMCAEAINEASNGPSTAAYTYINDVRDRAGLTPLSGLSQSEFREAVYNEERLEVAFEGHRWFDLVRTGRALTVMNSKLGGADPVGPSAMIDEDDLLYPIPQDVIVTSSPGTIIQNNGYN